MHRWKTDDKYYNISCAEIAEKMVKNYHDIYFFFFCTVITLNTGSILCGCQKKKKIIDWRTGILGQLYFISELFSVLILRAWYCVVLLQYPIVWFCYIFIRYCIDKIQNLIYTRLYVHWDLLSAVATSKCYGTRIFLWSVLFP